MKCHALLSARMACAKVAALGHLEAKYSLMRRALRVTTVNHSGQLEQPDAQGVDLRVGQLRARALMLLVQSQLRAFDDGLQLRVASRADDVVHARVLAPVDEQLAATTSNRLGR